jgi:transcriptional regulator with XRE-family HTH domain
MFSSDRFRSLLAERGMSQSELARKIGISQTAVNKLATGGAYGTKHIHLIARALRTSPSFLLGETDDPAPDAPIVEPELTVQFVTMQVALPSEDALTVMFEAMLHIVPADATEAERARILARRLPAALSQLRDLSR